MKPWPPVTNGSHKNGQYFAALVPSLLLARASYWIHSRIDQSHKSHNAPVTYPTIYHSEQKCDISVLNGVLWDMGQGVLWVAWDWSINCWCFMMTSSNGNILRVTGPLCGEFTGPGEFPSQRSVTRSFDLFFDLRLNKRLSKQSWGWWFETQSRPLWRHCNVRCHDVHVV